MQSVKEKSKELKSTQHKANEEHQEEKLHGAFISVLILGAFIVGSWLAIYFLFLSR